MPNPFAKSRKTDNPYAIYICGDFTWHVLKTYKMPKSEVERFGVLVAATPEWLEAYGITKPYMPTPDEYLDQTADA